ncbi:hypothetical protein LJC53_07490 [Bacteroidales bacterium OttesenSCG-928-C03]|nr:hypothetical protein [Bacteroidales bacterium OttesenSCG-928-C03]
MKKSRNFPPTLLLLLVSLSFACISCREDYDEKTYYKAKGEGYVFMCDAAGNILHPIEGAYIYVQPRFDYNTGLFAVQPDIELYYSDANGKYQVSFLKRTNRRDVTFYLLSIDVHENGIGSLTQLSDIDVDSIKDIQNNIITIDTIKLYRK